MWCELFFLCVDIFLLFSLYSFHIPPFLSCTLLFLFSGIFKCCCWWRLTRFSDKKRVLLPSHPCSWPQAIDPSLLTVTARRMGHNEVPCNPRVTPKHQPGVFEVEFELQAHGTYMVDVQLFGVSIDDSPFSFEVTMGETIVC